MQRVGVTEDAAAIVTWMQSVANPEGTRQKKTIRTIF